MIDGDTCERVWLCVNDDYMYDVCCGGVVFVLCWIFNQNIDKNVQYYVSNFTINTVVISL